MRYSNQLKEQVGFWSGCSITEYIHVINQVVAIYIEYTKPLCMAYIDYEKASLHLQGSHQMCENLLQGSSYLLITHTKTLVL